MNLYHVRINSVTTRTINICFHCSEVEYVRGQRAHLALHMQLGSSILAIPLIGISGALLWLTRTLHWLGVALIGISLALAFILGTVFLLIPPLTFRRESRLQEDVSLTFSPESVHLKTKDVDSQLQWSTFSMALIDSHSYLLYSGKSSFALIPKRVFQDADQQKEFEQQLLQQIPKIITRKLKMR